MTRPGIAGSKRLEAGVAVKIGFGLAWLDGVFVDFLKVKVRTNKAITGITMAPTRASALLINLKAR